MRVLSILLLAAFVLPLAVAQGGARHDESFALGDGNAGTVYVSLCRGISATSSPAVELVADCLTTGVYEESNGFEGAQVDSGIADGVAYAADVAVLAL